MIIDWELSIKLAGGNEQTAKELLALMIKSLPDDLLQIKNAFEKNQVELLKNLLHKLRGALCYCGLPRLKEAVETFENAVKAKKEEMFPLLFSKLEQTIKEIIY